MIEEVRTWRVSDGSDWETREEAERRDREIREEAEVDRYLDELYGPAEGLSVGARRKRTEARNTILAFLRWRVTGMPVLGVVEVEPAPV